MTRQNRIGAALHCRTDVFCSQLSAQEKSRATQSNNDRVQDIRVT